MMVKNLLNLSDGHVDILQGVLHKEMQRILAQDLVGGEEMNYDKAAHLLTIYDAVTSIKEKWNWKRPQFGGAPLREGDQYREILEGTNKYLARNGELLTRPSVD